MRPAPAIVAMLAACNAAPQPQLPASGSLDSIGSRGQRTRLPCSPVAKY